jgi:hypothetical protein
MDTALMFVLMRKQKDINICGNLLRAIYESDQDNREIARILKIDQHLIGSTSQEVIDGWSTYVASSASYRERLQALKSIVTLDTAEPFISQWLGLNTKEIQDLIWDTNGS